MSQRHYLTVNKRALIRRINRRLVPQDQQLWTNRSRQWHSSLGDYYVTDINHNVLVETHIDLEELGRRVGALSALEEVAEAA